MIAKYLALSTAVLMLLPSLAGPVTYQNVGKEMVTTMEPDRIVLSSRNAQALPILAPLFKRGINISIDWGEGEYMEYNNISDFSAEIALKFWEKSDEVIVVNSYKNALLASPIASMKNIPILFYGDKTESTINELNSNFIIEIGDTPIEGNILLKNQKEVVKYTINAAKSEGISIDYITVVNPDDQNTPVQNLSSFGSLLAAFHNGILCTCPNDTECINKTIKELVRMLNENGMEAKYVCLVGDPESIPFTLVNATDPAIEEKNIATDNCYGDLDGNPLVPELAIGRFLANNLSDASALLDRYVNYKYYFDNKVINKLNWQSTAWSWVVLELPLCLPGVIKSSFLAKKAFRDAGFRTLRSITKKYYPNAERLAEKSNYIFVTGIHGTPYDIRGVYEEYWELHPSVIFMVSCSAGRTDNVTLEKTVTCRFIHHGVAAYIAPTRTTLTGWILGLRIYDTYGNLLGRLFFEELVKNKTVGKALIDAKHEYKDSQGRGKYHHDILYEFVLYGDPAFNPYEPCNEGGMNENLEVIK